MIKTARSFSLFSLPRAKFACGATTDCLSLFLSESFFRLSLNARATPKPEIWYFRSTLWSPARVQILYSCTHAEESLKESISDGNRSLVFSPKLGGVLYVLYRTFDTKARCFFRLLSTLTTGLDDEDDEEVYA